MAMPIRDYPRRTIMNYNKGVGISIESSGHAHDTNKGTWGVTLIELLVVMAVVVVIAGATSLFLFGLRGSQDLDNDGKQIVAVLRDAQQRSITQENIVQGSNERWGVHFMNPLSSQIGYYEVFRGTVYPGVIVYRRNLHTSIGYLNIPSGSSKDVFFDVLSGVATPSTIHIGTLQSIKVITINNNGTITIQ